MRNGAPIAFDLDQQNAAAITSLRIDCVIVFDPKSKKQFVTLNATRRELADLEEKGYKVYSETAAKLAIAAMAKGLGVNVGVPEVSDMGATGEMIVLKADEFNTLSISDLPVLCASHDIFVTPEGDILAIGKKSAFALSLDGKNLTNITPETKMLAEKGIKVGILGDRWDLAEMLPVLNDDTALIYFDRDAEFKKMKAIIDSEVASGESHPVDFLVKGEQDGVITGILLPRKNLLIFGGYLKSLGYKAFEGKSIS